MKLACASKNGTYVGKVDQYKVNILPFVVRNLIGNSEAWIVGSTAKWLLGLQDELPKDVDVLVPLDKWNAAARGLPRTKTCNSMGGFKIPNQPMDNDDFLEPLDAKPVLVSVDVWPSSLECYLQNLPGGGFYAVHPNTGTSLKQDQAMGWANSDGSGVAASDSELARHIMPDLCI